MEKRSIAIAGLLLALSNPAAAKDKLDARTQAILACRGIAAADARLACYDQSIATIKTALEEGDLVVSERPRPTAMEGIVKASGRSSANRFWVELESGERWTLEPSSIRDDPPRVGGTIRVKKRPIGGGYWLSGTGWPASEASFDGKAI